MKKDTILVIGAGGGIGVELTAALQRSYGAFNVITAYLQVPSDLATLITKHHATQVFLLAVPPEVLPQVLDIAAEKKVAKVFWPSSIAPDTVTGAGNAAGEDCCRFYWNEHGLDVRSIRYPGLISHLAKGEGAITDYAVEMFHQALAHDACTCYLEESTFLPMMYMPDAIRATLSLMEAPAKKLSVRTSYNLSAMSFSPAQLARAISRYLPDLTVSYVPDPRQLIADAWPKSIDDGPARHDWGWDHEYDLSATTRDMLLHLAQKEGISNRATPQLQGNVFF